MDGLHVTKILCKRKKIKKIHPTLIVCVLEEFCDPFPWIHSITQDKIFVPNYWNEKLENRLLQFSPISMQLEEKNLKVNCTLFFAYDFCLLINAIYLAQIIEHLLLADFGILSYFHFTWASKPRFSRKKIRLSTSFRSVYWKVFYLFINQDISLYLFKNKYNWDLFQLISLYYPLRLINSKYPHFKVTEIYSNNRRLDCDLENFT